MKKNMWPLMIFGFLGLMVCAVIASVVIAISHPVIEDDSYFSSKKSVDENINEIIQNQNRFNQNYQLYLGINKSPQITGYAKLLPLYLAHHAQHLYFDGQKENRIYVKALPQQNPNLSIQSIKLYMEKINQHQKKIELGEMHYERTKDYFASRTFSNLKEGRYKTIFEVSYLEDHQKKTIFFEREVYAR